MIIVDANSILYRSFHGIPEMNRKSDGMPTNALYGLARQLLKIRETWPDEDYVPVVFDHPGGSFREKLYPPYKADRTRPEGYSPQAREARRMVHDLGFPVFEQPGFEADDTIAHLIHLWKESTPRGEVRRVYIVTGDKDLLQLVDDERGILVFDPWSGEFKGEQTCRDKFGVAPHLVPEVQALMGDKVDGIPGVKGIGVKKAAQLINEYGTAEKVVLSSKDKKGVMWANIRSEGMDILTYRQLALLSISTPLTVQSIIDTCEGSVYNKDTARAALDRYEFNSLSL